MSRPGFVAALAATAALCATATAEAQAGPLRALTITPALAEGISSPGQRIGPFTILNTTGRGYAVGVFPVLLGQRVDGSLFVREDPGARARARRFLELVDRAHFALDSGQAQSIGSVLKVDAPRPDFYGGVLFEGTPTSAPGKSEVVQVLQLNARISLRPPPELQRVDGSVVSVRAEQAGTRRLRFLARFANRGNVDLRTEGVLRVLDAARRVLFRGPLRSFQVIPGFQVDLTTTPAGILLPRGKYLLDARIRAGGNVFRKRATTRLFNVNTVATRRAQILALAIHNAYAGHDATLQMKYRNVGNVVFTPTASVRVAGGPSIRLKAEAVAPGAEGRATGRIRFADTTPREVTVELGAGGRVLDSRTVSVTPVVRPPMQDRVQNWIIDRALLLVGALGSLAAALLAFVVTLLVRRNPSRPSHP